MGTEVGLCAHCARAKRVETRRGSVFYQCRGAAEDPRLQRYPRLPVRSCPGYKPLSDGCSPDAAD